MYLSNLILHLPSIIDWFKNLLLLDGLLLQACLISFKPFSKERKVLMQHNSLKLHRADINTWSLPLKKGLVYKNAKKSKGVLSIDALIFHIQPPNCSLTLSNSQSLSFSLSDSCPT